MEDFTKSFINTFLSILGEVLSNRKIYSSSKSSLQQMIGSHVECSNSSSVLLCFSHSITASKVTFLQKSKQRFLGNHRLLDALRVHVCGCMLLYRLQLCHGGSVHANTISLFSCLFCLTAIRDTLLEGWN